MTFSYPVPVFTLAALVFCLLAGLAGCAQEDDSSKYSKFVKSESGPEKRPGLSLTKSESKTTNDGLPVAARKPGDVRSLRQRAAQKRDATLVAAMFGNPVSLFIDSKNRTASSRKPVVKPAAVKPKVVATGPRKVKLLVKDRKFRVEGPESAIRVNYDDLNLLRVLNMEPVLPDAHKMFPDWLKNLNGKRIRIRGFMSPSYKPKGLEFFLMGRDNKACCFPGRAKIYDLFPVKLRDGVTTDYIQNRPFDVVGIFQIKPWQEDGEWLRMYQIVDAVVVQ